MIMVGSVGLHMGVILVETEIDEARFCLVIPAAIPIPKLSGGRIKRDAIQRDAKNAALNRRRYADGSRLGPHPEFVCLGADPVGIVAPGELAHGMVRQAVGADDSLAAFHRDRYLI